MDITRTAYGIWSGGRFMHFGEPLPDERFLSVIRHAYARGIRTFITSDVYGNGAADEMLARGLEGIPREEYCLVGMVGHDFYHGERAGSKGYPRFTDAALRQPRDFGAYLRMATEKSLARCRTDHFDCLLLHNPDVLGYTHDEVWAGMAKLRDDEKMTGQIGVAPGPANGFTLDLLLCFERFGALLDWGMIILNPLEPWPGQLSLAAAQQNDVKLLTRVADYGGLFHDDVRPGHAFAKYDHRTFRPAGWVEAGNARLQQLRPFAERHGLTLLQLSCLWNLAQEPIRSVAPTMIQESGEDAKPIEEKIDELAHLPEVEFSADELEEIGRIGNNKGCMELKGGNPSHTGDTLPDRWPVNPDLEAVARRWHIEPERDLVCTHAA